MDTEALLLSKVVAEKDFGPLADANINQKFFFNSQNKRVYEWISRRIREDSQVPTIRMAKDAFPEFNWIKVGEPWNYLIQGLQDNYAYTVLEDALSSAVVAMDGGADAETISEVQKLLTSSISQVQLDISTVHDINVKTTGEDRLDRYDEIQSRDSDELLGIPFGFPTIDAATQGAQPGQLITLVGMAKAGKSTSMILAALSAWKSGKKVLFIGFEMSNEEQTERLDSIAAKVDPAKLRGKKGHKLSDAEWSKLEDAVAWLGGGNDMWFSNDTESTLTLSGIAAKIDKYQPDIVYVDGVYMMHDETQDREGPGSPRALTNITRGMKRLARNKNVPIIMTTQLLEWKMTKNKVTTQSIGYSSSFIQDSDVVIALEAIPEYHEYNRLKILLGRNVPKGIEVACKWDWSTGTFEETEDPENPEISGDGGDDEQARGGNNRGW